MVKVVHQSAIVAERVGVAGASGAKVQWLIHSPDGAENFFMRRFTIQPGGYSPRHTHPYEHEVYVLSGTGKVLLEGEWRTFEKDYAIFVPANVEHQFKNEGEQELVFLCIIPKV